MNYLQKYKKYKQKYLNLKNQIGGNGEEDKKEGEWVNLVHYLSNERKKDFTANEHVNSERLDEKEVKKLKKMLDLIKKEKIDISFSKDEMKDFKMTSYIISPDPNYTFNNSKIFYAVEEEMDDERVMMDKMIFLHVKSGDIDEIEEKLKQDPEPDLESLLDKFVSTINSFKENFSEDEMAKWKNIIDNSNEELKKWIDDKIELFELSTSNIGLLVEEITKIDETKDFSNLEEELKSFDDNFNAQLNSAKKILEERTMISS